MDTQLLTFQSIKYLESVISLLFENTILMFFHNNSNNNKHFL